MLNFFLLPDKLQLQLCSWEQVCAISGQRLNIPAGDAMTKSR